MSRAVTAVKRPPTEGVSLSDMSRFKDWNSSFPILSGYGVAIKNYDVVVARRFLVRIAGSIYRGYSNVFVECGFYFIE